MSHFLKFKVVLSTIYPKSIRDLAEKLGIPVEEIAASKGIRPGHCVVESKRRDIVEMIDTITEHPDNQEYCILNYVDGSFDVVAEKLESVEKKINRFLGENFVFHHRTVMYYQTIDPNETKAELDEKD